ncbi:hypothetical protein PIROE2DRAFT_13538 [Piromyces sp. E2]|nr:hypothetical protein PIROE2DRAFT_13538 [Piromyces sp. E2]|eukprot:OUM60633.1 hypothetical protein PIROE2DRAFT_13538 [Piromyces sp. E2]
MSVLPGYKEGVSGGIIAGYNIGIDGNIPKEKVDACITAFKYLSSKEIQRKYFLIENIISGITSLYDDEEICENVPCETMKKIQPINRPSSKYYHFSDYVEKFENYVYQYLYGNEAVENVLEKIEDLTNIHRISFTKKDLNNELALIIFIFVVTFSFLMVGSLSLLFVKKYEKYFSYMSKDSWIILVCGLIILIIKIFDVDLIMVEEGKNFEICKLNNAFGAILLGLIYIEWGRRTVVQDIHIHVIAIYIDIFSTTLFYITTYGFRIYLPFYKMTENDEDILKMHTSSLSCSKSLESDNEKKSFVLKLRDYHNQSMKSSITNGYISGISSDINNHEKIYAIILINIY